MRDKIKLIFLILLFIIIFYILFMLINLRKDINMSNQKLKDYKAEIVDLSFGKMEYLDRGEGEIILSSHGLFGGFDQAFENVSEFSKEFRIIAPSRFGYLNSDIKGDGSPKEQVKAYVELLDKLKIDKVFVLGTSAGGTLAIRFALDYPDRCKGVILYCSAMPELNKIKDINYHQGPSDFMINDYAMYLISPFFRITMGMDPDIIKSMLPINEKKEGIILDMEINNPDMAANFDQYNIETIKLPVLIMQSEDDKLVDANKTREVSKRFLNHTLKIFDNGGHMMKGHGEEVNKLVKDFINENKY